MSTPTAVKRQSAVSRSNAYKKLELLEHILLRAETYVGSKEPETMEIYIPQKKDDDRVIMQQKNVTFVPAFFKIFDEIIVNAADNKVRDGKTDTIKVTIDAENGEISVFNNGKGIPVVIHEQENIHVPELIFGHLLTGSNYDDDEKRVTGGRNGYGAKLTNIYSTEFHIETHDSVEHKTYKQKWTDNMTKCSAPRITSSVKKSDYTKVTFKPDLKKLNMESIDSDTVDILTKRVYDLTGSLSGVKVFLNGERIRINNFKDYISTYLVNESEEKPRIVYDRMSDRWEVAVALSESGAFQHVSFVNSIATTKGGTHVSYITDQIVNHLVEQLKKKHADISVKPAQIRNQLFVFVNCLIENPSFEGQVKEFMTLRPNKYGSTCVLSDAFMKRVVKLGILETTLALVREKDEAKLKKTDGVKRSRLTGIVKLQDANNAGTRKGKDCTLYIVEGESALSFAVTGIPVVKNGRDIYGAYPLRGKMLNVREASVKQKLENKEIAQLKQILGLQEGKVYTSVDSLRYGHICLLTDSDEDGKHIKGLVLNWLESSFPSLLKLPGFVLDFRSPIVKCMKGKDNLLFYTKRDYDAWKEKNNGGRGWDITYLKGLGSSEKEDVKRYFSSINAHLKRFRELDDNDSEHLDLVFSKKRAADRKQWLRRYDKNVILEEDQNVIPISDFIDKDFITFSMYDNIRSIPSMVDGLKPGQRKILYTAIKTKLNNKIKVAQFAGKVSELTEYRHGEQSLCETITGLAQDFIGANNIALLQPRGQFGTRRKGGKDAAAARYIFTNLDNITRKIFPIEDDVILPHQYEDGVQIEPEFYVPVLPMVLVNGAEGIGSGYSTTVLNYDPHQIIDLLTEKTLNSAFVFPRILVPWYKGFTGKVEAIVDKDENFNSDHSTNEDGKVHNEQQPSKWAFTGKYQRKNATTLEITELPIHMWTENYKEFLEEKVSKGEIKDYKEYHTDSTVQFVIQASEETLDALLASKSFEKDYKLVTTKYTSNMMLFSPSGKLRHYETTGDILDEFYDIRIQYYEKRKNRLLEDLREELCWATNKARFIKEVISGKMKLVQRSKKDIVTDLEKDGYHKKNETTGGSSAGAFDYLLNMPLHTLTKEKVQELTSHVSALNEKMQTVENTSKEEMYRVDLQTVRHML